MTHAGTHALVLGLGRSGAAAARLLLERGARVTGYDRDPAAGGALGDAIARLTGAGLPDLEPYDLVVTSPGFALAAGIHAIPEIDLAAEVLRADLVGVTGTNGKSSVTELCGEMLRRSGRSVAVGGNLGTPLSELADEPCEVVVAELSSFQLERATRLRARVAVLLNLAPDHLDRHGDLAAYGAAKARLAELQAAGDTLVVNLDDAWARSVPARGRRVGFTLRGPLETGGSVDGKDLVIRDAGEERVRLALESLGPGVRPHPANALAAALAALAAGATAAGVREALEHFDPLPHRGTLVCAGGGVRWVDDSKATNPAAAAASLRAQRAPVVWLLGGRNKGLAFDALTGAAGAARVAICYGEAGSELAAALGASVEVERAPDLEVAVGVAAARARDGDVVLLAPACASFDAFASFEARGERFAELARRVAGVAGAAESAR